MPPIITIPIAEHRSAVASIQTFDLGDVPAGSLIFVAYSKFDPDGTGNVLFPLSDDAGNDWSGDPTPPGSGGGSNHYFKGWSPNNFVQMQVEAIQGCLGGNPITLSFDPGASIINGDLDIIVAIVQGITEVGPLYAIDAYQQNVDPGTGTVVTLDTTAANPFGGANSPVSALPEAIFTTILTNRAFGANVLTPPPGYTSLGNTGFVSVAEQDAASTGDFSIDWNFTNGGEVYAELQGFFFSSSPPSGGTRLLTALGVGQ